MAKVSVYAAVLPDGYVYDIAPQGQGAFEPRYWASLTTGGESFTIREYRTTKAKADHVLKLFETPEERPADGYERAKALRFFFGEGKQIAEYQGSQTESEEV